MALANYGARQTDINSTTKTFQYGLPPTANWIYKNVLTQGFITPENNTKDVLIQKNLIVNGSIINPSDINIKKNINNIPLEEINNISLLKPKMYNFIEKYDDENMKHYGFIAQELEEIYPNLIMNVVNEDDGEGDNEIKGINYFELIPLLIGKINNMQMEMDEMKKEINQMKKEKND
jgi:hypothetical protein